MTQFNISNIVDKWPEMTPLTRLEHRHLYREAMGKKNLVSLWDYMTQEQKLYLLDIYKVQCKQRRKINKKRALSQDKNKAPTFDANTFNQRFILNIMNRYTPKGYKFVIIGDDRRIAIESSEIMGNQHARGAFVSDLSFDIIEGVYGGLFKNDKEAFTSDIIYWRIRGFTPDKPHRTTKEKHEAHVKTLENIAHTSTIFFDTTFNNRPLFRKNAILVQGIMDSGKPAPKYLNDRLHNCVNDIVWCAFCHAMRNIKASMLVKYRNTYKKNSNRLNVVPGARSEYTMWRDNLDLQEEKKSRIRLEYLKYDVLPQATENKNAELIAQTQQEITKLNKILGPDYTIIQKPARNLLHNTFYKKQKVKIDGKRSVQTIERQFPEDMHVLKQIWLLLSAKEQKSK